MILVTGATGNVGGNVVRQLLEAGESVRAVTRNPATAVFPPGVEVVGGDLTKPESLAEAFDGVDRIFLFPSADAAEAVAELARERGVRRVVVLSAGLVEGYVDNPIAAMHRSVEDAVEASGLAWTFLRPGGFATNTLAWAGSIRSEGVVRAPYGGAVINLIHEADVAAVATAALLEDGHEGAAYRLTGPGGLTQVEQAQAIGQALGRDVRFEELTPEQGREHMTRFAPAPVVDTMLRFWADAVGAEPEVLSTVEQVTGRPARSFGRWAHDHVEDFR